MADKGGVVDTNGSHGKYFMMRFRLAFIMLAVGIWYSYSPASLPSSPSDIRVLNSSGEWVEFIFSPQGLITDTIAADGQVYTRFIWDNIDIEGVPGQPGIPVRNILIGLPPGATPNLQLGRENSQRRTGVRLPPIPFRTPGQHAIDSWEYREDADIYGRNTPIPNQLVTISEPYSYRGYWVAKVSIHPVQFYPSSQQARIISQLQIRITFSGPSAPLRSRPQSLDPVVQGLVINPEQTSQWHLPRTPVISSQWPSGTMIKATVRQEGIYKITGHDLELIGQTGIIPSHLRLFNNGGRELPRTVTAPRPDSLIENAIYVVDVNNNQSFDADDYLLFYGHGVTGWEQGQTSIQHYIHHYTEDNIYWLQIDAAAPLGKRMQPFGLTQPSGQVQTTTRARLFREDENFIYNYFVPDESESGIEWFMALFAGSQTHTYSVSISDVVREESFRVRCKFQHFGGSHQVNVILNDSLIRSTFAIGGVIDITGFGSILHNGSNTLKFQQTSTGIMYLDWFEVEYSRSLNPIDNELAFESPEFNGIVRYDLQGFSTAQIFNITDPFNVTMTSGTQVVDSSQSSVWRRYFAVIPDHYRTPLSLTVNQSGGDEYQDLRHVLGQGIHNIIICADEFYPTMETYKNHWEDTRPGMQAIRIRVSDIFDQFGWGLFDPTAIRDFLRHVFYVQNWNPLPEYLLLVGDGDYDYKNRISGPTGNWIPPYENGGLCADDWYVQFVNTANPPPEMAVGRWTVTSTDETETLIQKAIQYESQPLYGPWRHRITMVADDEYGERGQPANWEKTHVEDSENIAETILPRHFNLNKVYLTEYPVQWDATVMGRIKPQATEDLIEFINDGTLAVNFMGHGNPHVWTHEQVFLDTRDMPRIDNGAMLPLFVAATCSWGRFDDPMEQSFPEQLLVASGRGSIGSIAATRFTGPTSNEYLVRNFYLQLFQDPFDSKTMGLALLNAKIAGSSSSEVSKYHLLGDPSMVIGAPRFQMRITSTNTDTLQALSLFSMQGVVLDESGTIWNNYNGIMNVTVFDRRDSTTYFFDPIAGGSTSYILTGSPMFQGPCSVTNGHFQSRFVVPQDVAYGGQHGRFSFYYYGAASGDSADGAGVRDSIHFAETAASVSDSISPTIQLMLESENFRPGDLVSTYPDVIARISDSSGINLTGEIGHTLRLILDGGTVGATWDVTRDFQYNLDSYTQGEVRSTIGPIEAGNHVLRMEAWDSFNNLATTEVTFQVEKTGAEGFELRELLPYPNPFNRQTNLTFFISRDSWVRLKIYTVTGRMIYSQEGIWAPYGYNWELTWDGRDAEGDKVANGVYLYKLSATSTSGEHTSEIGRVVVMR